MILRLYFLAAFVASALVGINFDVEPHTLPNWSTKKNYYGNQILDLYQSLHSILKGSVPLHATYPIAFQNAKVTRNGETRNLNWWIFKYCEGGVLMAYRNKATDIQKVSQDSVNVAASLGKKVVLAFETLKVSPSFITFYGQTNSYMSQEISKAHNYFSGKSGYGGQGIHHYVPLAARNANGYKLVNGNIKSLYVWVFYF
jgi:hypothetical protein